MTEHCDLTIAIVQHLRLRPTEKTQRSIESLRGSTTLLNKT